MSEAESVTFDEESSPTAYANQNENVNESFQSTEEQAPPQNEVVSEIDPQQHGGSGKAQAPLTINAYSGRHELGQVRLIDHFSLGNPSSSVRFRNKRVLLYGLGNDEQIVLESSTEDKGRSSQTTVTVKRYRTGTVGMRFLRSIYTLVTMLVLGFLVVFCFQIILFLFLNMAANGGDTMATGEINPDHVFAVTASVPLHLYAMASILAMGLTVVQDTWNGNPLFQQLMGFSNDVLMESICVVILLIIPGSTAAITLLASMEDWWDITAFTWVVCILVFMVVFALLVIINEVRACLLLMRMDHPDATTIKLIQHAVLITQIMFYSGKTRSQYLQNGDGAKQVLKSKTSLYSKITMSRCCCKFLFTPLEPPVREFSADEVRDVVPFYTARNWSIERMFCRNPNKAAVFVQKGPGALRKGQIGASVAFSIVGTIMIVFLVAGILVWHDAPLLFVIMFPSLTFVCAGLPVIVSTNRLYQMYHAPNHSTFSDDLETEDTEDGAIFHVLERSRISEPTPMFCWFMAAFGAAVGFVWPIVSFVVNGEYTTSTFFIVLGAFSIPRLYLNPVPILRKMGPLNDLPLASQNMARSTGQNTQEEQTKEELILRRKAKLSALVGKVNNRSMVTGWMYFFGFLMLLVGLFSLAAFDEAIEGFDYKVKVGEDEPFFAPDFYYPPQPKLPYPTCKIAKHFSLLDSDHESNLIDIAYFAVLGFSGPDETGRLLREWFGEAPVVDEYQFVRQYREAVGRTSGVSFKLFSFPGNPGVGLVSIRGSESLLDWAVDVQLWLGAALAQMIRAVIPLGWLWTPILDELVYLANSVESDNLKKVSYYTTTTQFINDLLSGDYGNGTYTNLRVTGASLGGGLAIITGAQTNTTTIAISGLNAMISRRTFTPPISEEALNTHVFNIIPDRDPIAAVDDPGRLFQRTECRAPKNSFFGCHSMWRSVCEISYQCGTMARPVLCWCVTKYGYPEPIQNGTRSFTDVCSPSDP